VALLKDGQCELVILGTIAEATLTVLAAAHELEWSPVFLGSQAIYQENLATEPKGITENLYAMGQVAMPYPDDANGAMRSWIGRYEERFGARAGVEALVGYDLANLFIAALKAAGPDLTRERFAAALEELPPWTSGALGLAPLDYSASDHLGVRGGFLAQVKDGRWVTLAPVAIGE
ncbi:MAG TPA: ABC transporter substrate-binding protein, partial [Micropepsaceae bacterium]|nr:ABC transporter substrate-binding protein [Micropepsaceae bacterium]